MTTEFALIERIQLQAKLLIRAAVFYDIWRAHSNPATRSAHLDTMNNYSEYFIFNESVYLSSTINAIYALTETRPKTLNIKASMALAAGLHPMHSAAIQDIQATYKNGSSTLAKIALLRNNLFAHRSDKLSYQDALAKAQITPNDIRDTLLACLSALNALLRLLGAETVDLRERPRDDFIAMLDDLTLHNGQPVSVM